jgi:uncharacterized Zn-binding protein involved in type VI secretion
LSWPREFVASSAVVYGALAGLRTTRSALYSRLPILAFAWTVPPMPTVAINPPKTPVTKGSNSVAVATLPNMCKMPGPPAPFVPTPLPNIGKSALSPKDFSTTVKIEGNAVAIRGSSFRSIGDIASKGLGGGLVSMNCEGPTTFVGPGSMNVQIEGKNVQFLGDPMLNNCGPSGSPPNSATATGVVHSPLPLAMIEGILCTIFCECLATEQAKKHEMPMADMTAVEAPGFGAGPPPGRNAFQACVANKFNKEYKDAMPGVKAEQSFDMGPPIKAVDGMPPGSRRPDFVVSRPSGYDVIEMKFETDTYKDRYGPGQKRDYKEIGGGKDPTTLDKKSCKC